MKNTLLLTALFALSSSVYSATVTNLNGTDVKQKSLDFIQSIEVAKNGSFITFTTQDNSMNFRLNLEEEMLKDEERGVNFMDNEKLVSVTVFKTSKGIFVSLFGENESDFGIRTYNLVKRFVFRN